MNNYVADRVAGQLLTDPYGGAITDDNARDVRRSMPRRAAQALPTPSSLPSVAPLPMVNGGDVAAMPGQSPVITVRQMGADDRVVGGLESPRRVAMPMARPQARNAPMPMAKPGAAPAGTQDNVSVAGGAADKNQGVISADNSSEIKDGTPMTQGSGNPQSLTDALTNNAHAAQPGQARSEAAMGPGTHEYNPSPREAFDNQIGPKNAQDTRDILSAVLPLMSTIMGLGTGLMRGGLKPDYQNGTVIPPGKGGPAGAAGPGINQTIDAVRRQAPSGVMDARLAANPRAAALAGRSGNPAVAGPSRTAVAGPATQKALPAPRKALPAPEAPPNKPYAGNSSQVYGKQTVTAAPAGRRAGVSRTTARGVAPGSKKPNLSKDRVVQGLESPKTVGKRPATKRGNRSDKKASSK